VAGQALVAVLVDAIADDAVGNGRRLLGVVALAFQVFVFLGR